MSNKRAVVSVGLFILFVLLTVSAVMIEVEETGLQSFGLHVWTAVHAGCGIVFTVFVVFHLIYNWRVFKNYYKGGNK